MSDTPAAGANARPNFLVGTDCFVMFEVPADGLNEPVQSFSGWFAAIEEGYPEFLVNGRKLTSVAYYERPDVQDYARGAFSRAWTFCLDVPHYMTPGQGALNIEARWNNWTVGRKSYRASTSILPRDQRQLVAFLHMPKSGGTSLRKALEEHSETYRILASYEELGYFSIADLQNVSEVSLSKYDAIYGHFPYGIHTFFKREARYISLIRNPYGLVLSFYFYARDVIGHRDVQACQDVYEAFTKKADAFFDNPITRMFAGISPPEPVDEKVYRRAIAHIDEKFDYVGVLEYPEQSFSAIGRYLGLQLPPMNENVNPYPREYSFIDMAKFRAFSQPYLKFDLLIYNYVLEKFWGGGFGTAGIGSKG